MKTPLPPVMHRALLLLVALVFATAARAGTWSTAPWTDDSTSYISSPQTVWAYHFGSANPATVNGVNVAGIATATASNAQFDLAGTSGVFNNFTNNLTALGGTGSAVMAADFVYSGNPASITVKGLVAGNIYTVSFYGVDFNNDTRLNRFTDISSGEFRDVDEHLYGSANGIRVDYTFLATAATRAFTIAIQNPNFASWHLSGLALRQETAPTVVTNTLNSGTGSLRWALANAAAISGANTITFDPALSGATIPTLTELTVADAGGVTIDASALAVPLSISGGGTPHRLITHTAGSLTLRRLRFVNGIADATASNGANLGGAVLGSGTSLAAYECAFVNNQAGFRGGALHLGGSSTIEGCTFTGNTTTADGGFFGSGGAIGNLGTLTVRKSTFVNNATLFATATSFNAGAILNAASLVLEHCTITDNASAGTGARGAVVTASGTTSITNCLIADNSIADVNNATGTAGNVTYAGANLVRVQANALFTGPAPLTSAPLLGALGANGGFTETRVPQFGSPAIDTASVIAGHSTDQRGVARPFDGDGNGTATPDLGAVEARFPIVSNGNDSGAGSLRQAVADAATFAGPDTIVFRAASFPTGGTVNLTASLAIPAVGDTAGVTLLTTVTGGNVDVAVNAGIFSWGEGSVWTGGGRILLGATSGSAPATVELTGSNGLNVLAAPVIVRSGSSGTKTLRDANGAAVLSNTFADAITLLAPATIEKLGSGPVSFGADVDLGAHLLSVSGTGNGPVNFTGRVFRGDGTGKAQLIHGGAAALRFTGAGDNTRLALTMNSGSAEFSKTSSGSVHAAGGGLTAADGPALTLGAGLSLICNGGDQIADTASVTLDGNLTLTNDETIDALNGTGVVNVPLGTQTLTVGAANGTGSFGGAFTFGSAISKSGTGIQTLSGSHTNTGPVTVGAGRLNITGTLLNVTSTTVQSGATLAGTGTIGASVALESGSNFAPGDATVAASIGTLNVASGATWNGGATARFHLSATNNSSDQLALGGALVKGTAGSYIFDFQGTGLAGQTYTLVTFASSTFTAVDFGYTGLAPGLVGYFTKTATSLTFTVTAFSSTVTSTADSGPGSLRQIIADAAQIPGSNTIGFPASLNGATITLSSPILIADSDQLSIVASGLTGGVTLSGGGAARIFAVNPGSSLALDRITLTGGTASSGGAINNAGTLYLARCTLSGNSATTGGAIFNSGTLTLVRCTLAQNSAGTGGAIASQGASAGATLTHCTVSGNSATSAGAIASTGTLTLNHSIVAGNTPDNVAGAFANTVSLTSGDPRLSPLAENGGPTKTMALRAGSPGLDAATGIVAGDLPTDQRGFPRNRDGDAIAGALPDIGAYEAQVAPRNSVGFNFVGGGVGGPGGTLAAADVAGVPAWSQGNWNNLSGTADGAAHDGTYSGNGPVPIVNASGVTFTPNLRLWWSAHHLWNISPAVQSTADRRLMNGYLDSNVGGDGRTATNLYATFAAQPFLAVAGLPALPGGFKVIAYVDGDATDRVGEYWLTTNRAANPASVAGETDLSPHVFVGDNANFSNTFTRVPATSTSNLGASTPGGNYVAFEGLTEPGFIVRAEEGPISAPINAVQVVPNEIVVVTTAADEFDANGTPGAGLSLREALRDAPDGAGILFDPALSGATLTLDAARGELVLTKDVTLDASNLASGITVHGGSGASRILTVSSGKVVTLRALTLTSGDSTGSGGAVLNQGWLTLTGCTLTGNSAVAAGGAIHTEGAAARLHATRSTFAGNLANGAGGGAVSNDSGATTTLTHCTVSANQAPGGTGAGIRNGSGVVRLGYCIVAGNTASDVSGTIVQAGANLIGGSPLLAALASNGGPTQTMALLTGSPARDAATGSPTTSDQRGFPIVGVPDIGAYEASGAATTSYSAWSLAAAGSVLPATDDTERDGAINALEYALRRAPLTSDPSLSPTLTGPAGGRLFTFRYQPTANDLRYIVQRNPDLANAGGWTEVYRFDTSTGAITELFGVTGDENSTTQVITLTDPAGGSNLFWRLRIELLP